MKKTTLTILIATLIFGIAFGNVGSFSYAYEKKTPEMKAIWVPTVLNITYPKKPTTDSEVLKSEAITILDNIKDMGFDTVFFQVRPANDALYKSNIFPWSTYLTGSQGTAPSNGFDPLAFWITEAHKRGLELHAWINPYRVTANKTENTKLSSSNPAVSNPSIAVTYDADGKMYLNPGEPQSIQLVKDGIAEIINNYDVDGIHLDDYFYPGTSFPDAATFAKYGSSYSNIGDWRRANTEKLIKEIQTLIKNSGKSIEYGISPFAIWANKKTNPLGSDTNGKEDYYTAYADSRLWVRNQYIDYIMPQIYWEVGHALADYSKLLSWWVDVVAGTNVKLYIGHAAYRSGNTDSANAWYGTSQIKAQMDLNAKNSRVNGYGMYAYNRFIEYKPLYDLIKVENANGATSSVPNEPTPTPTPTPTPIPIPVETPTTYKGYTDVLNHSAKDALILMIDKGIMNGVTKTTIIPNANIKRADYTIMMFRLFELSIISNTSNFSDVPKGKYYTDYIGTAKQMGIVNGIGNNKYAPESNIRRDHAVLMFKNALATMQIKYSPQQPSNPQGLASRAFVATMLADYTNSR